MSAAPRPLKMLLVPSNPWRPNWEAYVPGTMPDPRGVWDLLERDHAIRVVLSDPLPFPLNPLVRKHQVYAGLDPLRALSILARHRDADVVLTCFEPGAAGLLALRHLAGFRTPVAIIDIGLTEDWAVRRRLLDFVVPRADAIYPLGQNQVEYIHRHWRTRADVRLIHQHIDPVFYQPGPPAGAGPVLSVGDDHGRDFPTLLQAFAGLPGQLVLKTRMVDAASQPANVQVVSARLPALGYRALFEQASIVVVPLRDMLTASGVGTVLEAMAMGKPLILSDSAGIRDYVIPDETALVVPCGDAAALRAAIQRLQREPHTRARLGAGARAFVMRHCTYAAHAATLAKALRELALRELAAA